MLVPAKEKCRRTHFWVVVAPGRHVLFRDSPRHDSDAVDSILGGYSGDLVVDANAVYTRRLSNLLERIHHDARVAAHVARSLVEARPLDNALLSGLA